MKCSKTLLNIPHFGNFDDNLLLELSKFVVIEHEELTEAQIKNQFEFLTRTVQLAIRDWKKFVLMRKPLRTKYSSIFKNYKSGMFKKSGILLLRETEALCFSNKKNEKEYVYFSLTKKLSQILQENEKQLRILDKF